jgi:very-short-patch-repair endonuclease
VNDYARELRNNATDAERLLWRHLIGRYVCDFVCLEALVLIELDGSQHVVYAPYDANRDVFLRSNGFRVLRFWNGDVLRQTHSIVETIYEALHRPEMDGRFD